MAEDFTVNSSSKPEEIYKQISEKSQCLLMSVSDKLASSLSLMPKNIVVLDNEQSTIVSRMTVQKGIKEFMRLSTSQISMLVPRIRLYKSWLNNPNKPDTEFLFNNFFRGKYLSVETGTDYQYLGNVGIKSFEFVNQGTDFATNYIFKCKLELIFGNIEELTAKHYQSDGTDTSFLDLLLPPRFQTDEQYFRLKAVMGFARPGGKIQEEVVGTAFDSIPEVIHSEIDSWNFIMFLERINYNFTFEEDGTISLSIDFISSLDRSLESEESDILATPEIKEYKKVVASLSQSLMDIEYKINNEILPGIASAPDSDFSPFVKILTPDGKYLESNLEVTEYLNKTEQDKRAYLTELNLDPDEFQLVSPINNNEYAGSEVASPALIAYKDISERLTKYRIDLQEKLDERYQKIMTNVINNQSMFYFDIDIYKVLETLTINTAWGTSTAMKDGYDFSKIINDFRKKFSRNEFIVYNFSDIETSIINKNYLEEQSDIQEYERQKKEFASEIGNDWAKFAYNDLLDNTKDDLGKDPLTNKDKTLYQMKYRVNFVRLGDLVDSVLEILKDNGAPSNHFAILFGDITYSINDRMYRINIADLPVTREILLDWYNTEIFDAKRDSYSLRQFLVSLLRKIIPAVMNAGCWADNRRFSEEIEIKVFTLPKGRYEQLFKPPYNRYEFEKNLEGGAGRNFRSNMDYLDIVYIKSQNFIANNLKGNIDEDFEKGIYHFYVASDKGLVKKINFNKVDDANIIASNINKAVNKQKFDESTITTFYDANLELVGNTLFTPGQIIYINPTFAGLGNPKNRNALARKLGIGGYYDVLQVSSYISPGEFTTKIKAKWKGFTGEEVAVNETLQKGMENIDKELAKSESNREAIKKYAEEYEKQEEQKERAEKKANSYDAEPKIAGNS